MKRIFGRVAAAVLLVPMSAGFLRAQSTWTGGLQLEAAAPQDVMKDYFGSGAGFGLVLHHGAGPVALRFDGTWTHFGEHYAQRHLGGTGPGIGIVSSASFATVLAGPSAGVSMAGFQAGVAVQGGGGYVTSTGSTVLPGDPSQVMRSNTYGTFTWAAAARASLSHRVGPGRASVGYSLVMLGQTDFLREYNLPIGVISGIYLYPTPYQPMFTTLSVAMTFGL